MQRSERPERPERSQRPLSTRPRSLNYYTLVAFVLFHAGSVAALFFFTWPALLVAVGLWWLTGGLGVGVGYHRLLTHRSYRVPKALEYVLTLLGTLALQGGAIHWVATHRLHHQNADAPGDPHSPRDGGWWSHIGWMLRGTAQQHPPDVLQRYARDLMSDPVHVFLDRYHYVPLVLLGVGLLAIGGWSYLLWGAVVRVTCALHFTWLVNSATHVWGRRRFATRDDSRNNWWVALLSFGEGWHNNHHAHPSAARHGLTWYEVDVNWWTIRVLGWLGLARDIRGSAARARTK